MDKAELLGHLESEHTAWEELLTQISPSIMDNPGIMGAWKLKDLLYHIAWKDAETAIMVRNRSVDKNSAWWGLPLNERNQQIYEQHQNDSLEAAEINAIQVYADLLKAIHELSDDDLNIELAEGVPLWEQISVNTYGHYRQHMPDVEKFIADNNVPPGVQELISRIGYGWNRLHAYLKTLTVDQITRPKDAAGWTIKDHIAHLAMWENGINYLLNREPRYVGMGIDDATWKTDGFDTMNAAIQQNNKDKSLDEVMKTFQEAHNRLIAKIQTMRTEELMLPYSSYASDPVSERPVIGSIAGNTYGHYMEHTPWIALIAANS